MMMMQPTYDAKNAAAAVDVDSASRIPRRGDATASGSVRKSTDDGRRSVRRTAPAVTARPAQ